jgi:hypothetical protein
MDTLPLWAQIAITLLGVTNISSIVIFIFSYQQKNHELEEARLQRINDNLIQNTRPHIEPLYIPIGKILAKLESRYDTYKAARGRCHSYTAGKILDEFDGKTESQASIELGLLLYGGERDVIISFATASSEMMAFVEKMVDEGTVAYLTSPFKKQVDSFSWFLYGVITIVNTYLLLYQDVPKEQPKVLVLGTPEFEKEFYTRIDSIRDYINKLALGNPDPIESSSKKIS